IRDATVTGVQTCALPICAGIAKEAAMEGDARSTTHPIQQPIATEAEANSAFDDITYKKGQSFLRMLESFLGEEVFRDGIRSYIEIGRASCRERVEILTEQ